MMAAAAIAAATSEGRLPLSRTWARQGLTRCGSHSSEYLRLKSGAASGRIQFFALSSSIVVRSTHPFALSTQHSALSPSRSALRTSRQELRPRSVHLFDRAGFAVDSSSRSPCPGDRWHLDDVFLGISGRPQYLSRAVDQD